MVGLNWFSQISRNYYGCQQAATTSHYPAQPRSRPVPLPLFPAASRRPGNGQLATQPKPA